MLVDLQYDAYAHGDYVYNLHIVTNRCVAYTPDQIDTTTFVVEPAFEMSDPYTIPYSDFEYKIDNTGFLSSIVGPTSTVSRPIPVVQIDPPCLEVFIGY